MARKKEFFMDYATHAFVKYASLGCPTREEYEERIKQRCYKRMALQNPQLIINKANAEVSAREPLLKDIDAVNRVFEILENKNKSHISDAIRAVYFVPPFERPKHGTIVSRVQRFCTDYPCNRASVYRWLKSARLLFVQLRGLDDGSYDEKW